MHILILDDEINIVKGLAYIIDSFHIPHCTVTECTDSEQAIMKMNQSPADLAIVDINIPQMSGFDFIESAQKSYNQCKFVILSGYSEFGYAQQAIRLGVTDYLVKPVDAKQLQKIIVACFYSLYHIEPDEYIEMVELDTIRRCDEQTYSKHLREILQYIDEHFSNDVSATVLAEVTGLHPGYISALFLKEMNMSLHKYVNTLKLMRAMQLLSSSQTTISSIARSLGYSSERQFFRVFKQLTGQTPGQFREANTGEQLP